MAKISSINVDGATYLIQPDLYFKAFGQTAAINDDPPYYSIYKANFELTIGTKIYVKMLGDSIGNDGLKIGTDSIIQIKNNGNNIIEGQLKDNKIYGFIYDGTYWQLEGDPSAIKNITRSGTTFTATRLDGSTFTFTQRDNNTTYSAGTGLTLNNTKFNHSNSVTAKTAYVDTATTASANGGTIKVTDIKYDAQGHITGSQDRTITLSQITDYSYKHLTTYDFAELSGGRAATKPLSQYVTFDMSKPQGAPESTWYNGFISSHNDYLASYIINKHRTADWYVGYGQYDKTNNVVLTAPTWYKIAHSGNVTTGTVNGQIIVAGTAISVYGLKSAAYTESSAYATSEHNHDAVYVTKTGTGASGSWGISITGTAAKAEADASGNTITSTYATKTEVEGLLAAANAMTFKGVINATDDLPDTHNAGDTYRVGTAGKYPIVDSDGRDCEIGTLIICIANGTAENAADWTAVETNEDGAIIGSSTDPSDNAIVRYDGTTGRIIQKSTTTISDTGTMNIKGKLIVNPSYDTLNSYNEGIRINLASNGWANIHFGGAADSTSATVGGGWLMGRRGAAGGKFGAIGDFTIEEQDSSGAGLTLHKNSGGMSLYTALAYDKSQLRINNATRIAAGKFGWAINATSTMAATSNSLILVGTANSTKNQAYLGFHYESSGSDSNFLTLGFYGVDHLMKIFPTGQTNITKNIASTSTSTGTLVVSGGIGTGAASYLTGSVHIVGTAGSNPLIVRGISGCDATGNRGDPATDPDNAALYLNLNKGPIYLGVASDVSSDIVQIRYTQDASSSSTGAFIVAGGVGIGKKLFVEDTINNFKLVTDTTLNADDIRASNGIWVIKGSITNAAIDNHGALFGIGSVGTPAQFYIPDSSHKYIYKRWYSKSAWSDWTKISAGYADSAGSANTANTATNLATKPSIQASTSDTNQVIVVAGGKTSDAFTIPYATTTTYLSNIGRQTSMDIDLGTTTYNSKVFVSYADESTTTNKPPSNAIIFNVAWDNLDSKHYGGQIAMSNTSNTTLYLRGCDNGTWDSSWKTILDSNNYSTYTSFTSDITVTKSAPIIKAIGTSNSSARIVLERQNSSNSIISSWQWVNSNGTLTLQNNWNDGTYRTAVTYNHTSLDIDIAKNLSVGANLTVSGTSAFNAPITVTGSTSKAPLTITGAANDYREGIRIKAYKNWSDIVLGGADLTADNGISANSWFIGNNNGNFYIARNGSTISQQAILKCVDNSWSISGTVNVSEITATQKMVIHAGKVYSNITGSNVIIGKGTARLFGDGLAISNPAAQNDAGWLRVLGTGETDTVFEIATGDDGGAGEQIVVRQYTTSNTVNHEATLLGTKGETNFPVSVTTPATITDTLSISSTDFESHIKFARENWNYITYPNHDNSALAIGYATGNTDVQQLVIQKTGTVRPGGDGTQNLGDSSHKWSNVYAKSYTVDNAVTLQYNSTDKSLDFVFA